MNANTNINSNTNTNINIRFLYLAVGAICLFFAGIIYAWSIVKVPLINELGWDPSAVNFNYTVMLSCFCLGGMLPGLLSGKMSPG